MSRSAVAASGRASTAQASEQAPASELPAGVPVWAWLLHRYAPYWKGIILAVGATIAVVIYAARGDPPANIDQVISAVKSLR